MSERRDFLRAIEATPEDDAPCLVYADWLDEHGEPEAAEVLRLRIERRRLGGGYASHDRYGQIDARVQELEAAMSPIGAVTEPESYDWQQAFSYANGTGYGTVCVNRAAPHIEVDEREFARSDVAEVIAMRVGANDESNWVCVGRLYDGRWFALDAGCDYTGWD